VTPLPLSPSEKALLDGNHDFSKKKQRYLRYRVKKKIAAEEGATATGPAAAATPQSMPPRRCRDGLENLVSLVRIPPQTWRNEREAQNSKKWWAGRDLNPRSPPCQGGILTRLDHRPHIHAGKFIAQIYVIDPLSCGNTSFSQFYKDDSCCKNRNLLKKSECDAM
jgi:hypothetical protein